MLFPKQSKLPFKTNTILSNTKYLCHGFQHNCESQLSPRDGTDTCATGNSLALFNYSLAKGSPSILEPCDLTECKFQVIAGARNVFTWKCFAFTEIITLQNGNKTSKN